MESIEQKKKAHRGCLLRGLSLFGKAIWILALVEGTCSLIICLGILKFVGGRRADSLHVQYDAELGWRHQKNLALPNMYGEGRSLIINGQGFRADEDFTPEVPPGRVRMVCSGDSFTLGFGVRGDQVWHQLLTNRISALQVVNMGQAGYGVDQAYLWYLRDGVKLEHDVHLFAFISDDFERARYASLFADAKPLLGLQGGRPVPVNLPIPRRRAWPPHNVAVDYSLSKLAMVRLLRHFGLDLLKGVNFREPGSGLSNHKLKPILSAMFKELEAISEKTDRKLVFVYLPTQQDHPDIKLPPQWQIQTDWRRFIREEAAREGYRLIDLVEAFTRMPEEEAQKLFFKHGELKFALAEGHYNVRGNRYIADQLYQQLVTLDDVRTLWEKPGASSREE